MLTDNDVTQLKRKLEHIAYHSTCIAEDTHSLLESMSRGLPHEEYIDNLETAQVDIAAGALKLSWGRRKPSWNKLITAVFDWIHSKGLCKTWGSTWVEPTGVTH